MVNVGGLLSRVPRLSLRAKGVVLVAMAGVLAIEPILDARRRGPGSAPLAAGAREVVLACSVDGGRQDDVDRVEAYLQFSRPLVDRLLPAGTGGTRFVTALEADHLGEAHQGAGEVHLLVAALSDSAGVATELHERAHLAQFVHAREAARLMSRLPAPAAGEYAATSAVEHFAEMAGQAWTIVDLLRPHDWCLMGEPAEWLRDAEARVPGTAGFVAWYLRDETFDGADGRDALAAEAARLMAPAGAEWDALFAALEGQRRPDGDLEPWPVQSTREYLEAQRWTSRMVGGPMRRIEAAQLAASLWLLDLRARF
jgi:hypothetical protein